MEGDLIGTLLYYAFFLGIGISLSALIMRAIFNVSTIVNNLKQQTEYLRDIAVTQRIILKNQEEAKIK